MSERILSRIASSANMLRNSLDFTSNGIQSQPSFEARVKKVTDQIGEIIVPEFDDQSKGINEIVREHVRHFIDNTIIGYLYSQLMIVLNVLSCFQYIYLTYTTDETNRESPMYWTHFYLELGTACMFFLDWILAFLSSENKFNFFWRYVFYFLHFQDLGIDLLFLFSYIRFLCCSFDSCVDIMTVLPVLATLDVECPDYEHIDSAAPAIYYTLCAMTTSRILRCVLFLSFFLFRSLLLFYVFFRFLTNYLLFSSS